MNRREFVLMAKALGSAASVAALAAAYDTAVAAIPADAAPVVDDVPRAESDKVSAWLAALAASGVAADRDQFAALRRQAYAAQHAAWTAAGKP